MKKTTKNLVLLLIIVLGAFDATLLTIVVDPNLAVVLLMLFNLSQLIPIISYELEYNFEIEKTKIEKDKIESEKYYVDERR